MKHALVLLASPRKNGISKIVAESFLGGFPKEDFSFRCINLYDANINPCLGCYSCVSNSRCVYKDDMRDILEFFKISDIIACIGPVYFYSVSSRVRLFIERCFPLVKASHITSSFSKEKASNIKKKSFFAISVAAGMDKELCENIGQMYGAFSEAMNMNFAGSILRMESIYLKYPSLNPQKVGTIKAALSSAAAELAKDGTVCEKTKDAISARISNSDEEFTHHASMFWQKMAK